MAHEGIRSGFDELRLEDRASPNRDGDRLYPFEGVSERPVEIHAVENRAYHVKRRKAIGTRIDDVESQPLADPYLDGVVGVLRLPAVEDYIVRRQAEEYVPIDRAARIGKHPRIELALDKHELLGGCPALPWIDDDCPVHAVGDMERHRRGSAVIHERTGYPRDKAVVQRIVRHEVHVRAARGNFCGVK